MPKAELPTLSNLAEAWKSDSADVPITVDRPLDLKPQLGSELNGRVLGDVVLETAGRLRAAGVGKGDRVAVVKSNHLDITVLASATVRIGAFAAMLSGEIASSDSEAMLRRLERPLLITDRRTLDKGSLRGLDLGPLVSRVIVLDGEGSQRLPEAQALNEPPVERAPDEPIAVTHTSGTTGTPKMVVQSTSTLAGHVMPNRAVMSRLGWTGKPYAFALAMGHVRTLSLVLGASQARVPLYIITGREYRRAADFLAMHRPYVVETYPNLYTLWEPLVDEPAEPLANARFFMASFDALHLRTCRRILNGSRRRFAFMLATHGLSEMGPSSMKPHTRWLLNHTDGRCVGFPAPFVKVRIVDPATGKPVGRYVNGRYQVRSSARLITYLGEDERVQAASDGTWFSTGDIAYRTIWGCVHLLDREPEFDASFGSGLRVEDVLMERIPALSEVAVIHRGDGRRPTPVISTFGDEPLKGEVWQSAVADLKPMDEPVQRRWDEFPRTATAKVRRSLLRKELEATAAVPA